MNEEHKKSNISISKNIKINEIKNHLNEKVLILGTFIPSQNDLEGFIDDGSGSIGFIINEDRQSEESIKTIKKLMKSLKKTSKKMIKISGRVLLNKKNEEFIKIDYIQDKRKLNDELRRKVINLKNKLKI